MGSKKFGKLLDTHLKKSGLTKVALAKNIKKTDGYIRKILLGYTPPSLEICQKLALALALTTENKIDLYTQAALERMGKDSAFFDEIKRLKRYVHTPEITPKLIPIFPLQYGIELTLKSKKIPEETLTELQKYLSQFITETGCQLQSYIQNYTHIRCIVSVPLTTMMNQWIIDLKSSTSRNFKTRFPKRFTSTASIWETTHHVYTLGQLPECQIKTKNKISDQHYVLLSN